MTELSCGVARDLLPLYADGLAGEESRALVEAHLETCEPCRAELTSLRTNLSGAAPKASKSLRRVKGKLKKRLITAVCVTLAAALLLGGGWYYVDGYQPPMRYQAGAIKIDDFNGDGAPDIGVTLPLAGQKITQYFRVDDDGNRWGWWFVHFTEPALFTKLYFKVKPLPESTNGAYSWTPIGLRTEYGKPLKAPQNCAVYYVYDWKAFIKILNYAPAVGNDRLLDRQTGQLSEEALALCQLVWEGVVEGE
jgi:hypothetical protein